MLKKGILIAYLLILALLLPSNSIASLISVYKPLPTLQMPDGFEVAGERASYRFGDISISSTISSNHIIGAFKRFNIPDEDSPYAFQLFRPVVVEMPAVEEVYAKYGYNRAVRRLIYYYKREKKSFAERLKRAGKYIDEIARILVENDIPPELSYLPLIESGFKTHAYSPKRAAGPWQFIPATAKKYGLKIDWWVDERRDPIKSTLAAAKYLRDLYNRYGDWNLALAAYNAGEGRIDRAIRMIRKKNYWRIRQTKFINRETKNYVPSFIAATAIALEPERFGFSDIETHEPLRYDLVEITTPIDLAVVASFTGSTISEIKALNPELRRWCTPPNVSTYTLRIPKGTKDMFLANLSRADEDDLFYVKLHRVKPGDTVGKIARQLGTSIQAIIELNSLGKDALIVAGRTLLVPVDRTLHGIEGMRPILKARNL
jgi:membrane-bound lytic murein transglycosylase D